MLSLVVSWVYISQYNLYGAKAPMTKFKIQGKEFPFDEVIRTQLGKRTHKLSNVTGYAVCGAGRPSRQFPEGSVIPIVVDFESGLDKPTVPVTCYKCLKIDYMTVTSLRAKQRLVERDFSPTHEGNRTQHIMIPEGRHGFFGSSHEADKTSTLTARPQGNMPPRQWAQTYDFQQYFAKGPNKWHPGMVEARTQPHTLPKGSEDYDQLSYFTMKPLAFVKVLRQSIGATLFDLLDPKIDPNDAPRVQANKARAKLQFLLYIRKTKSWQEAKKEYDEMRKKTRAKRSRGRRRNPQHLLLEDNSFLDELERRREARREYVYRRR
jgi:hypothetical protein